MPLVRFRLTGSCSKKTCIWKRQGLKSLRFRRRKLRKRSFRIQGKSQSCWRPSQKCRLLHEPQTKWILSLLGPSRCTTCEKLCLRSQRCQLSILWPHLLPKADTSRTTWKNLPKYSLGINRSPTPLSHRSSLPKTRERLPKSALRLPNSALRLFNLFPKYQKHLASPWAQGGSP